MDASVGSVAAAAWRGAARLVELRDARARRIVRLRLICDWLGLAARRHAEFLRQFEAAWPSNVGFAGDQSSFLALDSGVTRTVALMRAEECCAASDRLFRETLNDAVAEHWNGTRDAHDWHRRMIVGCIVAFREAAMESCGFFGEGMSSTKPIRGALGPIATIRA